MREREAVEFQWPYIASLIGSPEEIERSAIETGALVRRREVKSADTLLRLAITYSFGLSLRQTAAYAQTMGLASISNVGLLKRLRRCDQWLGELLARKLAERAGAELPHNEFRLRIVDATTVNRPGTRGTDWRLHIGMNLRLGQIDHVELTDSKGGETLTRFAFSPFDLVVADRGYAHRNGLQAVARAGARFIVRINWQNLPLEDRDRKAFDILSALRPIGEGSPTEFLVQTRGSDRTPILCRLVAVRKSEPAAARTRKQVISESLKKGRTPDPRTLESAGFMYVLTNVPAQTLSAAAVLELYRFRWQIEMNFKDLKSVLHLDSLPAKDPALARTYLFGKLLGAFLIDDLTSRYLSISPWGYKIHSSPRLHLETAQNSA